MFMVVDSGRMPWCMSYSYAFSDQRSRRCGFGSWTAWVSWHLGLLSSSILMIVDGCGLVRLPEWLPFLVLGVGLLCTLAAETATGSVLTGGRCGRSHEILGQSMLVLYLIGLLVWMQGWMPEWMAGPYPLAGAGVCMGVWASWGMCADIAARLGRHGEYHG